MKISGFEKIISIDSFEYLNCTDEHEVCFFTACMKEEDIDGASKMVGTDIEFEDDDFKFTGHVTDVSVSKDISGCYIKVRTIGKTYQYDQEHYTRVFQQSDKTISDILSHMKSMSDVEYQNDDDPVIDSIILQNDETEWDFIKCLVNRFDLHLFSGEKTFIGKNGKNQIELDEQQLIDYTIHYKEQDSYIVCRTDTPMDIGSQVKFSQNEYYVVQIKYILENEKFYFEYLLLEKAAETVIKKECINAFLTAKVTDNNDPDKKGRLQVDFENENIEDCMKDSPIWINRTDIYANGGLGIVYIPQIDDIVRIHLYNGECSIIGCIRSEAYASPFDSPDSKYLLLDEDIYFQYNDGTLVLHIKDNQLVVSEDELLIASGDKVTISTSKERILIQKDKTAIEVTSDINASGGKVIIEAKSDASISGTSINIKGKSGVSIN